MEIILFVLGFGVFCAIIGALTHLANWKQRAVFGFLVGVVIGGIVFIGVWSDEVVWNNGICSNCKHGTYELFDVENYEYYYKCNNCNYVIWTTSRQTIGGDS